MQSDERAVERWQQAEEFCLQVMVRLGFLDAELTGAGPDGGVDIRSTLGVAQVKLHGGKVGRPVVQQIKGCARDQIPIVFSWSGFKTTAIECADDIGVALFGFDLVTNEVETLSGIATYIARQAAEGA